MCIHIYIKPVYVISFFSLKQNGVHQKRIIWKQHVLSITTFQASIILKNASVLKYAIMYNSRATKTICFYGGYTLLVHTYIHITCLYTDKLYTQQRSSIHTKYFSLTCRTFAIIYNFTTV